ncbi:MAG: response regulator transcription factor [Deltaproteobacteria bacterium]|nr:response regulator transcription factor [Deltaproteobacteria bacterium]
MSRILIVEDEEHLAQGLQFNLEAEGHSVEIAGDGPTAAARLEDSKGCFDLVLLDLMLPGMSGFEVARRARAAGNLLPILILTAKDAVQDLVRGLEEGADDYLTKPFRLDELLARVRGLLRRRRWDGVTSASDAPRSVAIGDTMVHFDRFELETPGGAVSLTTRETGLLRVLVDRDGGAVTRGELLEEVWGLRPETKTRVVDNFIVRLRRYLEADPSKPRYIVSVRGHGYRLVR